MWPLKLNKPIHTYKHTYTCTPTHIHTHTYTHTPTRTRIHPQTYTHTSTRTHIDAHTSTHIYPHTNMHPHPHPHSRPRTPTPTHIHAYTCIYMYICWLPALVSYIPHTSCVMSVCCHSAVRPLSRMTVVISEYGSGMSLLFKFASGRHPGDRDLLVLHE